MPPKAELTIGDASFSNPARCSPVKSNDGQSPGRDLIHIPMPVLPAEHPPGPAAADHQAVTVAAGSPHHLQDVPGTDELPQLRPVRGQPSTSPSSSSSLLSLLLFNGSALPGLDPTCSLESVNST